MTTPRTALVLFAASLLGGCIPPPPLVVGGSLPPRALTYTVIAPETLPEAVRLALDRGLAARGMAIATARPDRFIDVALSDRPLESGAFAGERAPLARKAPEWIAAPRKRGLLAGSRREVRLTIAFRDADGQLRETRTASEGRDAKSAPPDMAVLIARALSDHPPPH